MSWRDTLFIWRGRFVRERPLDPELSPDCPTLVHWRGSWIGVDAGGTLEPDAPEVEAFADEALPKFAIAGHRVSPDVPEGFTNGEYRLDKQTAPREDGSCLGWQLENGAEGLAWFRDDEHRVRVDGDDVFAVGRNGFAPFVSVGVASGYAYELRRKKPWTLGNERRAVDTAVDSRVVVMARRYLDEKDARAKMRLDEWAAEAKRHRARDAKKKKRVAVERPGDGVQNDGVRARQGEPRSEKNANGGVTRQEIPRVRVADEA